MKFVKFLVAGCAITMCVFAINPLLKNNKNDIKENTATAPNKLESNLENNQKKDIVIDQNKKGNRSIDIKNSEKKKEVPKKEVICNEKNVTTTLQENKQKEQQKKDIETKDMNKITTEKESIKVNDDIKKNINSNIPKVEVQPKQKENVIPLPVQPKTDK